jgi:hypothetical protein
VTRIVPIALLAVLSVLTGCDPAPCVRRSDCASGLVCSASGACIAPPSDGSVDQDAGDAPTSTDAALRDAPDAGDAPPDAGELDAGDAADIDGSVDGGDPDGGDAIMDDAGVGDAGAADAAGLDGAIDDAGADDAGADAGT